MDLPKYIHGRLENLPNTLGSRVTFLRNARELHIAELSREARVSLKLLEEIESGIETWLSVSIRQRIARVLKVDPIILEEVEIKIIDEDLFKAMPHELIKKIEESILSGEKEIYCPLCKNLLRVWIQEGFDLNENPIKSAKANCTECLFQLKC